MTENISEVKEGCPRFRQDKKHGHGCIDRRNDKGDFKRVEILNEEESDEQPTDDGPDAFQDVDLSDGGDIFLDVLGIKSTPVSEKGALGECDREEDQERGIENWPKTKSLARSEEKNVSEYSSQMDGQWKGDGKKELEEHKDLYFTFYFINGFTNDKRADGYQDEPVGQNDSESELVPLKRDEKFSHQDDLSDDAAQSLNEKRRFEPWGVHGSLLKLKFGVRGQEFGV